jgi:hypothetical protein
MPQKYGCTECDKEFETPYDVVDHVKAKHPEVYDQQCIEWGVLPQIVHRCPHTRCLQRFDTVSDLDEHIDA